MRFLGWRQEKEDRIQQEDKQWIVVVVFVGLGSVVFAFGSPFGDTPPCAGNPGFRDPIAGADGFPCGFGPARQHLNLSKEQLEKMNGPRDCFLGDTRDLRYALAQEQMELRKLFADPKSDKVTLLEKQVDAEQYFEKEVYSWRK